MNQYLIFGISSICLFLFSLIGVRLYGNYAIHQNWVDVPNDRSSHQSKTPRGAGIVFISLWVSFVILCYYFNFLSLWNFLLFALGVALVSLIGYWDDHQSLSARFRLLAQFIVAASAVILLHQLYPAIPEPSNLISWKGALDIWKGFGIPFSDFWLLLPILGIVWSINLFNFMDGLDGLAATEAIFVLGMGGVFLWQSEVYAPNGYESKVLSILSFGMTFTLLGFLIWNWPKAFVFMGDVGSYGLGFLIALFAILGNLYYSIPIVVWLILYGVFWFDTTVTLIRRMMMGKAFMASHCEHAYQRLHQAGFSHRQVLCWIMILNGILAAIAWWVYQHETGRLIGFKGIFLTIILLSICYGIVEYIKPMKNMKNTNNEKDNLCETF